MKRVPLNLTNSTREWAAQALQFMRQHWLLLLLMSFPILLPIFCMVLLSQGVQFVSWFAPSLERLDLGDLAESPEIVWEVMIIFVLLLFNEVYFPTLLLSLLVSAVIRRFNYLSVFIPLSAGACT
ncbi:MAG: hypothetical protein EA369_08570 [Bradymonadales bacterium]|nr:MAG: hypothetical protein EA369_08570 [Bradymonadales bacterium]